MRVVQSVKHTKRGGAKVIREGWLTHYTDRDSAVGSHPYCLHANDLILFHTAQTPLLEIGLKVYHTLPE
jgi:hypothetical protein